MSDVIAGVGHKNISAARAAKTLRFLGYDNGGTRVNDARVWRKVAGTG